MTPDCSRRKFAFRGQAPSEGVHPGRFCRKNWPSGVVAELVPAYVGLSRLVGGRGGVSGVGLDVLRGSTNLLVFRKLRVAVAGNDCSGYAEERGAVAHRFMGLFPGAACLGLASLRLHFSRLRLRW